MKIRNLILENRDYLSTKNYVRKADPKVRYWFDFSRSKLESYRTQFNDQFNLILFGDEFKEGDFYILPFLSVADLFQEASLSNDRQGRVRWVGSITNHELKVTNHPITKDISLYYGNPLLLDESVCNFSDTRLIEFDEVNEDRDDVDNEYAIQNRIIEIQGRQKQSVFRKKVLNNFNHRCCLTGMTEDFSLRASHIVPWATRIDSRLDPSNGLSLSVTYDHLFDQGLISFDDDLKVILTPITSQFSFPLRTILDEIKDRQATSPQQYSIKERYLEFHRDVILRK